MSYSRSATRSVDETQLIIQDLQDNGYSVVGGVLSGEECSRGVDGAWEWLASLGSGIKKDDKETWKNKYFPRNTHGLVQHYNVGSANFCWEVRMNPNVRKVFASIWGSEDLVTSLDGVCIKRPPELTKCHFESEADRGTSWLHCDQSKDTIYKVPTINGWQCIQGGVNLEETSEGDGCFRVLSGSHKFHMNSPWQGTSKDWYKISDSDFEWYKSQGCIDTKVTAPKGSIVLWDSRAIHASTNPVRGRANPGRFRMTVFVCMNPRRYISSKVAKRRRIAFEEGRTTSHWPARMNLFGKNPRTYGNVDACTAPGVVVKKEWEALL